MIKSLSELVDSDRVIEEMKSIFFESSTVKTFESVEKKESFYQKWLGVYIELFSNASFIFLDDKSEKVLGYIVCCTNTLEYFERLNGTKVKRWENHYRDFPAHLHINCHADSRGRGVGTQLLQHLERFLKEEGIHGLHLITSTDARNVSFYQRSSYQVLTKEDWKGVSLLLLGKKLL